MSSETIERIKVELFRLHARPEDVGRDGIEAEARTSPRYATPLPPSWGSRSTWGLTARLADAPLVRRGARDRRVEHRENLGLRAAARRVPGDEPEVVRAFALEPLASRLVIVLACGD